jgi:opacity protein-like surface antigen
MARRAIAVLSLGLLAALPATAGASSLELRIGGFWPRADSNLFRDDSDLYTVDKKDWAGVYGGAEFSFTPSDHVELGIHLDGYGRRVDTNYRDYTRPSGGEILQSLKLTLVPLGATLRLFPIDRDATVSPYVGVGPDLVFYKYEEFGDFIDFADPELTIRADDFVSDGMRPGFHVTGGLRVRVGHDFSILGEGRYQWAKGTLGDDFSAQPGQDALRLDMSGFSAVVGLSIRF